MAIIAAFILFLVRVLSAALSRQVTDEFKAWIPWIIKGVIRRAIGRLPDTQRERFEEEWQSHINDVPGEIGKLVVALGFLSASSKIAGRTKGNLAISLDVFLSAISLILVFPAIASIALAVSVTGNGPVFAVQERLSSDGRTFRMYRFSVSGRVGIFLYKTSLCDLPQLINVLRGEMTLVGPQALRP